MSPVTEADVKTILSELQDVTFPLQLETPHRPPDETAPATCTVRGDQSAGNKAESLTRAAYFSRLETFRTELYFAKPAALSPLICARFG